MQVVIKFVDFYAFLIDENRHMKCQKKELHELIEGYEYIRIYQINCGKDHWRWKYIRTSLFNCYLSNWSKSWCSFIPHWIVQTISVWLFWTWNCQTRADQSSVKKLKDINPIIRILHTSGIWKGLGNEVLECGCNSCLLKPFNFKELSNKFKELLEDKGRWVC